MSGGPPCARTAAGQTLSANSKRRAHRQPALMLMTYDEARRAAVYACCRKYDTATDVKLDATSRAARGLIRATEYSAPATHGAMHHGHVRRSPTARRRPVPRDRSVTSPPPADSTYSTNGARNGLVTQSFVMSRPVFVRCDSEHDRIGWAGMGHIAAG